MDEYDIFRTLSVFPLCRKCKYRHIDELLFYTECLKEDTQNLHFNVKEWMFICKEFKGSEL
jgi:hypothetical protein